MAVFVAAAQRTPIKLAVSLAANHPARLGATVIFEMLACREKLAAEGVGEVITDRALQAGAGQNPARQAAYGAGHPKGTPALTLNMVCGSDMKAVHMAVMAIAAGEAEAVVAGGQEVMSPAGLSKLGRRTDHGDYQWNTW